MFAKQALRKKIGQLLREVDPAELASQSEAAANALRVLPVYQRSKSIAFYMHMDHSELQTTKMISNAFRDGKRVFLPHIVPYGPDEDHSWFPEQKRHLRMLELATMESVDALVPRGKYKLKEPTEGLDCLGTNGIGLDIIILPAVAFTKAGGRLGHGAGFYDSFINEYETKLGRVPKLIGVGLTQQLLDPTIELPVDVHERPLDYIILGDRLLRETE